MALARITLTRAKTLTVIFFFVSCARFPCVRTHTTFRIAWPNPPTEEGPSSKRSGCFRLLEHFSLIHDYSVIHIVRKFGVNQASCDEIQRFKNVKN